MTEKKDRTILIIAVAIGMLVLIGLGMLAGFYIAKDKYSAELVVIQGDNTILIDSLKAKYTEDSIAYVKEFGEKEDPEVVIKTKKIYIKERYNEKKAEYKTWSTDSMVSNFSIWVRDTVSAGR
jgi:hypothetical protein